MGDGLGQRRRKVVWMPASAGMTRQTAIGGTNVGAFKYLPGHSPGALEVTRPAVKPEGGISGVRGSRSHKVLWALWKSLADFPE